MTLRAKGQGAELFLAMLRRALWVSLLGLTHSLAWAWERPAPPISAFCQLRLWPRRTRGLKFFSHLRSAGSAGRRWSHMTQSGLTEAPRGHFLWSLVLLAWLWASPSLGSSGSATLHRVKTRCIPADGRDVNWGAGVAAPWPWGEEGSGSGTSRQTHGVAPWLAWVGRHRGRPRRGAPGGALHGNVLLRPLLSSSAV